MHLGTVKQLHDLRKKLEEHDKKLLRKIIVCHGPGCLAGGAQQVGEEFEKQLKQKKIKGVTVESVKKTGCHGLCEKGPLVAIEPDRILYTHVKPRDVSEIIDRTIKKNEVIEKLLYVDHQTNKTVEKYTDIKFYSHQTRIALRNNHLKNVNFGWP